MPAIHPRIQLLPDHLINQIAAGEVIECPASVVKELLDNTMDAGADGVVIEIEKGGIGLIRVRDNGCGIEKDDLALAITRHATSKIRSLSDLQSIMTLGFRGEALPSVGSISRTTVTSRPEHEELAWVIKAEGRSEQSVPEPVSHPVGTTIEVRDLFFNTPARRKYLRTERTEFYQIQQLVRHFAIAHPEMAIKLSHNGKSILNLKSDPEKSNTTRVEAIFGKKIKQSAVEVNQSNHELHLHGWLGLPDAARTINDSQFFCLNGRCIRDKRINHAVVQAYQGILPEGRYPVYALYLSMEPTQVDVNVHPAKTEVRFRDGRNVHDFIYSAMRQALQGLVQPTMAFSDQVAHVVNPTKVSHSPQKLQRPSQSYIREAVGFYQTTKHAIRDDIPTSATADKVQNQNAGLAGQIGTVALIRKEDELILVDKLATARLFLQERSRSIEHSQDNDPPLLFPVSLKKDKRTQKLLQHQLFLQKLGFDLHFTEQGNLQLRRLPVNLTKESEVKDLVAAMIHCLDSGCSKPKEALIESIAEYQAASMTSQHIESMLETIDPAKHSGILKKLNAADLLQIIQDQ